MEDGTTYYGSSSTQKTWSEQEIDAKFKIDKDILIYWSTQDVSQASIGSYTNTIITYPTEHSFEYSTNLAGVACHHTECHTFQNKTCILPFRYKGRLYSTCITIDSPYAWCSLKTDDNYNHIDDTGNRGQCQESCLVQNCPLGFFHQHNNCYHISAMTSNDLVNNVYDAEEKCHNLGSRLYQPRDYRLNTDLLKGYKEVFKKLFHSITTQPQYLALGAITKQFPDTGEIYYNDKTRAYFLESVVAAQGALDSSTITDQSVIEYYVCLFMGVDGALFVEECGNYSTPLGYICEAKPLVTKAGNVEGKQCHFPFNLDANDETIYHSCIYNDTARYSWCFTELDDYGIGKPDKTGICPDEREITYDGPGAGKQCNLPFLYDRVWFDMCALEPRDEIWCPTYMNSSLRLFNEETDEYGYCTGYLGTDGSSCNTNYDVIDGKCIRVSPFPETYEAASAKCRSEGSYLLSILDSTITTRLKSHIEVLSNSKVQYLPIFSPDLSAYWVGGQVKDSLWTWEASGKNFSQYSDWVEGKENEGCVQNICTRNYKLTLQAKENYQWMAVDGSQEKPYICESFCKSGYLWFKETMKCLRVVKTHTSIGQSLFKCSQENNRLLSFSSCDQIENLPSDLKRIIGKSPDKHWIGIYSKGMDNLISRRISAESLLARPILRSDGYSSLEGCSALPDSSGTDAEIGLLEYSYPDSALEYIAIDSDDTNGYICEQENEWTCPKGYYLFQENCYKAITNKLRFSDAYLECMKENSVLTEISTEFQKLFILEMLKHETITEAMWTGYRKDPASIVDDLNTVYHSHFFHEFTHAGIDGEGNCVVIDPITNDIQFSSCEIEFGFICQQEQTPLLDKIEAMHWPNYVHPLDNVTETTQESFVGFSGEIVRTTELRSSADFMGEEYSYLTDQILPLGFNMNDGLSIGVWIYPKKVTPTSQCILTLEEQFSICLLDGTPVVTICDKTFQTCKEIKGYGNLRENEWQYLSVTFDSQTGEVNIFINETYGIDSLGESSSTFIQLMEFNITQTIELGIHVSETDPSPLMAKLSCLQIFNKALSISQVYQMSKICHVPPTFKRSKECSVDSYMKDNICYELSSKSMTYVEAQHACTSPANINKISVLAFPHKFQIQQELLGLAKQKYGIDSIYMGIDSLTGRLRY